MRTFVIAEIGSCHDGSLDKALQLVEAARDAGADCAKAQFWSDPDRLADRRRVPEHYRDIYLRYQVPRAWLPELAEACAARTHQTFGKRPIEFMATCYLPDDVAVVAPFVRRFKVASFEAEDLPLLKAHAPFLTGDRELLVSMGMNAQPRFALALPYEVLSRGRVRMLHCVSAYPAPIDALNLAMISDCYCRAISTDPRLDGFSDHTDPALTWTGALAVAAGASIIEAHLRLYDTDPENPDAPHAMTPRQFTDYVRHIRFAEACLGSGEKRLQDAETPMAQYKVRA